MKHTLNTNPTDANTAAPARKLLLPTVAVSFLAGIVWFGTQLANITASLAAPTIF